MTPESHARVRSSDQGGALLAKCSEVFRGFFEGLLRPRIIAAAVISGVVVFILYRTLLANDVLYNQYDDSYITYRYAVHLARGEGLVFNVGEKTDAASSFSYTILLAFLYRIGLHNLELVAVVIGIGSAALTAAIVFYTSSAFTRTWMAPIVMALLGAYHGFTSEWADSGMETTFYGLIVTAFVARFFFARKDDRWTVALVSLAALTRIEGILLAMGWLLSRLLQWRDSRATRSLLQDGAWLAAVLVLFYTFKFAYYGTPLPHSFLFKEISYIYRPRPEEVISEWRTYGTSALILGASGLPLLKRRSRAIGLGAFLLISAVALLRGPWSHQARYSAHLLPTLLLVGALALDELLRRLWPLALAMVFLLYGEASASYDRDQALMSLGSSHQSCRGQVGRYAATHVAKGTEVISSDLGKIAYKAIDLNFIDMFGLTSADVLKAYSHVENADEIVERKRPAFVLDTYYDPNYQALHYLNGGVTRKPLPPSRLAGHVDVSPPEFKCVAIDGTTFQMATIHIP